MAAIERKKEEKEGKDRKRKAGRNKRVLVRMWRNWNPVHWWWEYKVYSHYRKE